MIASGRDLRWSGQTVVGEGTWFSSIFQQPIDEDWLTAIAAQDGTLYAFTRRRIYAIAGEAPSDNGASGGLGPPRRLACDVGCIDPRSVVVTSAGIFFRSERGIELLNRGGSVVWVGEPVRSTLASYPVMTSAVLDSRNNLVRFTLAESEADGYAFGNSRTLVFDLAIGSWISVDKIAANTAQDAAIVCYAGVWRYAFVTSDGYVYVERLASDQEAYLDGRASGTWITMAAETAWFKAGGLQGKQILSHVLLLARKHTDLKLKLSLAYNYEQGFRSARAWSNVEISGLLNAGWPITQLKHEAHNDAPCQAVRIRIEDAPDGVMSSGKGSTWIGLTLDIVPKPGVFDVPTEAT